MNFPAPNGAVDAVRVLYSTQDQMSADLQQIVYLIRTITQIQRTLSYAPRGAIVLRGSPAQVAVAEWLFGELDRPATPQTSRTEAYDQPATGGRSDAVRLFFFSHNETQQDLQEIINMIRTTAEIQFIASYPPRRAIALRGTPAQIALAEWLVGELGKRAGQQPSPR